MEKVVKFTCKKCNYKTDHKLKLGIHMKSKHRSEAIPHILNSPEPIFHTNSFQTPLLTWNQKKSNFPSNLEFQVTNSVPGGLKTTDLDLQQNEQIISQTCPLVTLLSPVNPSCKNAATETLINIPNINSSFHDHCIAEQKKWKLEESEIENCEPERTPSFEYHCQDDNSSDESSNSSVNTNQNQIDLVEKSFACTQCAFISKWESSFVRHMRTHTAHHTEFHGRKRKREENSFNSDKDVNQLQFKCDKCNYCTESKRRFNQHSRVHKEEKRFACTECTYRCKWKQNLNKHVRIHTGEKPYKCSHCEFSGRELNTLKYHLFRYHSVYDKEPLQCEICTYETIYKSVMKKHCKKHEIEKPSKKLRTF